MMKANKKEYHTTTTSTTMQDDIDNISDAGSQQKNSNLNRFLSKTYHMVNTEESSIIGWAPGGESFLILNTEKFAEVCIIIKHYGYVTQVSKSIRTSPVISTIFSCFYLYRNYYQNTSNTRSFHHLFVN
jgi:hypothetical protein